jgi:hypothetical protein
MMGNGRGFPDRIEDVLVFIIALAIILEGRVIRDGMPALSF